jgi:deoxycytidine triphosphate deaminase
VLRDQDIQDRYVALLPKATMPNDPDGKDSPIQPASLDLTIGDIFLPEKQPHELGGTEKACTEHVLEPGSTAVVVTKEEIHMPPDLGGIGFPPTKMSNRGILMTNPGHVDPGYTGHLTFTVINMGRSSYTLGPGEPVVTLVIFPLQATPQADYAARRPAPVQAAPPVTAERMTRLAPDMLDVNARISRAVNAEGERTRRLSVWVPLVVTLLVGAFAIIAPLASAAVTGVEDVKRRVAVLEQQGDVGALEDRIATLEQELEEARSTTTTTLAP